MQGRLLGPQGQRNFINGPIVFIGNKTTAARLGCPINECGCFFDFNTEAHHTAAQGRHSWTALGCKPSFKPIRVDKGRPWCLCQMPQPAWLKQEHPAPWREIKAALVMGHLDGMPSSLAQHASTLSTQRATNDSIRNAETAAQCCECVQCSSIAFLVRLEKHQYVA